MRKKTVKENSFTRWIEETANLPKDVLSNVPIVRMYGKYDINIENFKCILEYTETDIRLQCFGCILHIHGKRLRIPYYNFKEIMIKGCIEHILFH